MFMDPSGCLPFPDEAERQLPKLAHMREFILDSEINQSCVCEINGHWLVTSLNNFTIDCSLPLCIS